MMNLYTRNYFLKKGVTSLIDTLPSHLKGKSITLLDVTAPWRISDDIIATRDYVVYVVNDAMTPAARSLYAHMLKPGYFISIQMPADEIREVLHAALAGEPPRGPKASDRLLTPTEINVIFFLSLGLSSDKCARLLQMSKSALSSHKCSAMHKMGVNSDMALFNFIAPLTGVYHSEEVADKRAGKARLSSSLLSMIQAHL